MLNEDVHSAIDKRYDKNSEEGKDLHNKAAQAQFAEKEARKDRELGKPKTVKVDMGEFGTMDMPDDPDYDKKSYKYEMKEFNKECTKNKCGEHTTKSAQFPKSYKNVGTLGEPDAKELEQEKTARKAAGKRKAKMNKSESLEKEINNLKEAVDNFNISEVSVGALARAAANNAGKRKKEEEEAVKGAKAEWDNYEKSSVKHPEDEPALYRKAEATDKAAAKAVDKAEHAEDVIKLNLPKNSKVNANKLFKAAQKVDAKREKEADKAVYDTKQDRKEAIGKIDRARKSMDYVIADPVKARTNEELMEEINSLKEVSDEIFEAGEEKEIPQEENKIKRVRKTKDGKKVETVSVEDELFPYEGNAKEQMQQKIIAKINDMIEGQATLQDLINLVRQKKNIAVKENLEEVMRMGVKVLEMLEPIDEVSKKYVNSKIGDSEEDNNKEEAAADALPADSVERELIEDKVVRRKHKLNRLKSKVHNKYDVPVLDKIKAEEEAKNTSKNKDSK